MGRLDTSDASRGSSTGVAGANDDNLPNLEATSLKMIAQTCAAK